MLPQSGLFLIALATQEYSKSSMVLKYIDWKTLSRWKYQYTTLLIGWRFGLLPRCVSYFLSLFTGSNKEL
jgi:hypothetical protein